MESAFKKHEEIIMAGYGTAEKLKALCLNLYNPHNPCRMGRWCEILTPSTSKSPSI